MTFTIKLRGDTGGLKVADYRCVDHGIFTEYVPRNDVPDDLECPECGELAPWTISAPLGKVKIASVTTGKQEGPPHPGYLSTRDLGDGMPVNEWRKKRAKYHEETRRKRIKEWMR